MNVLNDIFDEECDPVTLGRALRLACERIADSAQTYGEANTAEGWFDEFIRRASPGYELPSDTHHEP
jgi:hypothetical protein